MKVTLHKGLTLERWQALPFDQQLLHIVSELTRAKNWIQRKDFEAVDECLRRALELVDLTVEARVKPGAVRELLRFREVLAGFYVSRSKTGPELLALLRVLVNLDATAHRLLAAA